MKKIIIMIALILVMRIVIDFTFNKHIIGNNSDIEGRIIVKIEDIEYDMDKTSKLEKKKRDQGYIVYSSGQVIKYDNIENKERKVKTINKDTINNILNLSNEIDVSKISTINTLVTVTKGEIITVYNNENKAICIKDFYNTNYSDAANEIIKILKEEKIIYN